MSQSSRTINLRGGFLAVMLMFLSWYGWLELWKHLQLSTTTSVLFGLWLTAGLGVAAIALYQFRFLRHWMITLLPEEDRPTSSSVRVESNPVIDWYWTVVATFALATGCHTIAWGIHELGPNWWQAAFFITVVVFAGFVLNLAPLYWLIVVGLDQAMVAFMISITNTQTVLSAHAWVALAIGLRFFVWRLTGIHGVSLKPGAAHDER
jgi:hypothetical protein